MLSQWGRRITAGLLVLAAAYVGATWWAGKQIEKFYMAAPSWQLPLSWQAVLLNDESHIELVPHSFERGLFHSTATFSLHVVGTSLPIHSIEWQQHIEHGPFPWSRVKRLQWLPVLAAGTVRLARDEWLANVVEVMPEGWAREISQAVRVRYQVGLSGATETTFTAAPLQLASDELDWQSDALAMTLRMDKDGYLDTFSSHIDALAVRPQQADAPLYLQIVLHEAALNVDQQSKRDGRLRFHSRAETQQIHVHLEDKRSHDTLEVRLDGLMSVHNNDATITASDTFIHHATSDFTIQQVAINGRELGRLQADWDMENVNVGVLSVFANEQDENIVPSMESLLEALLAPQPKIELKKLAWQNEGGEAVLNVVACLAPNEMLAPTQGLLPKANAKAALRFDRGMLQQLSEDVASLSTQYIEGSERAEMAEEIAQYEDWLDELVALKVLQQKDEQYSLDAEVELEQGLRLFLNSYEITEGEIMALWFMLMLLFNGASP